MKGTYREETSVTSFNILKIDFNKQFITIEFGGEIATIKGVSITDYGFQFDMENDDIKMSSKQWDLVKDCYMHLFNLEFDKRWYKGEIKIGHTVQRRC